MSEGIPTGEKEPAQWEQATGDKHDQRDFLGLLREHVESTGEKFEDSGDFAINEGEYILRRGDKPIGYFLHEPTEANGEKGLFIIEVYVRKSERSPGVFTKLVQTIQRAAQSDGATFIEWRNGGEIIPRISEKLRMQAKVLKTGNDGYRCTVEKFSTDAFLDRI